MSDRNPDPLVVVALIGLVGTLFGGLFANWDKIFPPDSKKTTIDTPKPIVSPTMPSSVDRFIQLRKALGKPDWRKADEETGKALVGESETINPVDIEKISCEYLKEINKLWSDNSGGRFGIASQMKKWQDSRENARSFAVSVGWHTVDNSDISYDKMLNKFSLSSAKDGQLPRMYLWKFNKQEKFKQFFDKFNHCSSSDH